MSEQQTLPFSAELAATQPAVSGWSGVAWLRSYLVGGLEHVLLYNVGPPTFKLVYKPQ